VGAAEEHRNIEIVRRILKLLGRPPSLIRRVRDRLGHDRRYAIDSSKLRRELRWKPARRFDKALAETVGWYVNHRAWWKCLIRLRKHKSFQKKYYR
jgi:dTDP-glucose 4,6-dehydratase